jgi:hypothetical protein
MLSGSDSVSVRWMKSRLRSFFFGFELLLVRALFEDIVTRLALQI